MKKTYHRSSHCRLVHFQAEVDFAETPIRKCTCSFCLKSGNKKALIGYYGALVGGN